ncbi:hypothetical protein RAC90_17630 [Pantoea sp. CS_6]|uniref:hypothetical protein n=1 Tax=Pantoea TaxID=53335 RepID=UPI000630A26E|nr:hypothetical protein [Pantoea stewartii]KKW51076.1 hypothetical protein XB02_08145 [Pantoea ananatis]
MPKEVILLLSQQYLTNTIIGEAALNLIAINQDVSVESLVDELRVMKESEVDEKRLLQLADATKWLMGFRKIGARSSAGTGWSARKHPFSASSDNDYDDIFFK